MKKTLLIITTILLSFTSSYAYQIGLQGQKNGSAFYNNPNTQYINYWLEVTGGAGTSVVSAKDSRGGHYFESVRVDDTSTRAAKIICGSFTAPANHYFESVYIESVLFAGERGYIITRAWW